MAEVEIEMEDRGDRGGDEGGDGGGGEGDRGGDGGGDGGGDEGGEVGEGRRRVAVAANRLPEAESDSLLGLSRNWTVVAMLLWNLVS